MGVRRRQAGLAAVARVVAVATAMATAVAVSTLTAASTSAADPPDATAAASWQQLAPISPPGASPTDPTVVTGIACPAARQCALAGSYRTTGGEPAGLLGIAEAGSVSVVAAPVPDDAASGADADLELDAVACASVGDCVAVGDYRAQDGTVHTLVETLSAGGWTPQSVPLPSAPGAVAVRVVDVACNATGCAALGSYQSVAGQPRGLALVRNAGRWQAQDVTLPPGAVTGQGLGVSCPASGACAGFGTVDERPVLVYPSTGSWRAVFLPVPAGVDSTTLDVRGLSCATSLDCVALGSYQHPNGAGRGIVAEWLRAGVLSVTTVRLPAALAHRAIRTGPIGCAITGSCAAVGQLGAPGHPTRPIVFTLHHKRWTAAVAPTPGNAAPGGSAQLAAISCPAAGSCTAVGGFDHDKRVGHVLQRPYAVRLTAGSWTATKLGRPGGLAGVVSGALYVLSCAGTSCLTAGTDVRYDADGGVRDYGAFLDRRG